MSGASGRLDPHAHDQIFRKHVLPKDGPNWAPLPREAQGDHPRRADWFLYKEPCNRLLRPNYMATSSPAGRRSPCCHTLRQDGSHA